MSRPVPAPPTTARAVGYSAAAWCLFFAAVSAWQVVAGPAPGQRFAGYASGLAIMSVLVGVLKLARRSRGPGRGPGAAGLRGRRCSCSGWRCGVRSGC